MEMDGSREASETVPDIFSNAFVCNYISEIRTVFIEGKK